MGKIEQGLGPMVWSFLKLSLRLRGLVKTIFKSIKIVFKKLGTYLTQRPPGGPTFNWLRPVSHPVRRHLLKNINFLRCIFNNINRNNVFVAVFMFVIPVCTRVGNLLFHPKPMAEGCVAPGLASLGLWRQVLFPRAPEIMDQGPGPRGS